MSAPAKVLASDSKTLAFVTWSSLEFPVLTDRARQRDVDFLHQKSCTCITKNVAKPRRESWRDALMAVAEARGVPYVPLEASCSHCDEAFGSGRERHARVGDDTICQFCHNRWKSGEPPINSVRRPAMCLCCGGSFSNNRSYAGPHGPYTTCESCDHRRRHGKTGPAEPEEASYCRDCGCGSGDCDCGSGGGGSGYADAHYHCGCGCGAAHCDCGCGHGPCQRATPTPPALATSAE